MPLTRSQIKPNVMKSHVTGFTLLEVLVALVVLSIGLLGLAGLQILGLRYNNQSYELSVATNLANDMADRMRANLQGVAAGNYNSFTTKPASDPGCDNTTSCDAGQLATHDAFQWYTGLASLLPSGTGTVTGAGLTSTFTIAVSWTEVVQGQGPQTRSLSMVFRP
jgi:type IV pilus assembly protein PilV